jgi:hypothetical protein
LNTLRAPLASLCLLAALGCQDTGTRIARELAQATPAQEQVLSTGHTGPPVVAGNSGPARFVGRIDSAFDAKRAMASVEFIDGFYRAPGNDGYNAVLDHLAKELRAAGYGTNPRLEIEEIESEITQTGLSSREREKIKAWTPLGGRVALRSSDGAETVLHEFSSPEARDRVMLPVYTPAAKVEGKIVFSLEEVEPGSVLVMEAAPRTSVLTRARSLGAIAVVSASLQSFNEDPSGAARHLDAIQFRTMPAGLELPVVQISPRSFATIHAALEADASATLSVESRVRWDERTLRTLVATIVGEDRPDEAVVTVSHVQEPGAGDNATGVAGLLESARLLAGFVQEGRVEWPSRSLVFIWGDEFRQSQAWLESTERRPVAGLSSDMTGQSREKTGAIALLERMPDPGALTPLAPDQHTPWGAGDVDPDDLIPNGLAVIARCALVDVGKVSGGWQTAEHPWEGGSDHDEFIARKVPAALFWHFTDFAYHTSLDRIEHVDPDELQRTAVALLATAMALADPKPEDLDRYLRTLQKERILRMEAAEEAGEAQLAVRWRDWCDDAREWLRIECLRIPPSER